MIYVPNDLPYSACYVVRDNYTIRAYEYVPTYNSTINYIDIATDNHYIYREGQQQFSNYTTLPSCVSSDRITNAWSYRTDLADILICIFIIIFILYFILIKPVSLFFRGHA